MYKLYFLCLFLVNAGIVFSQPTVWTANTDEQKVGPVVLPEVLAKPKGKPIKNSAEWSALRTYWLNQFKDNMYGALPAQQVSQQVKLISSKKILGDRAMLYQWELILAGKHTVQVLGVLPAKNEPVPVFLGLNFCGNASTSFESDIKASSKYVVCNELPQFINHRAQSSARGSSASRWPYAEMIAAGYGSITASCADFEEDYPEGYKQGVRGILETELGLAPSAWSAMGAWAWGLSQMMNLIETVPQIDAKKVIVHGHSRLGKAALWAAANDTRFAAVISNNSGEGGAALTRRQFGEDLWRITTSFPHWFIPKYKTYAQRVNELPFDQHTLLALMAPRPLYIASAAEDLWADPRGEYLSGYYAEPVYQLFGYKGLGGTTFPALNTPVGDRVRYHVRGGHHDINLYDWKQYIKFAQEFIR